jgi:hydrogenase-1 operon protein HyaF
LEQIGVRVERESDLTGAAPAVLRELDTLLARLIDSGAPGRIDLKGLPLSPADLTWLATALGEGEVRARVETMGATEIFETAIFGVWRVCHRDEAGNLSADFIEVTQVPEILKTHIADVQAGRARLGERLRTMHKFDEGDDHVG